ncbi:catechol O-methyltransferase B-like isoform X1 [Rana temporaria]|uniref:catechol O-methyltransferase B-like isoform X1 n=1 Tax=Rana temporaria TaxID=8407 RepID=UPI001AAC82C3|nr:catechol O-methyltransferase B-like isoform X1 [Rana temporaria]XP_040180469.1 catechol O-methyltransferase B-like isoform X1 [Rana temporaria]
MMLAALFLLSAVLLCLLLFVVWKVRTNGEWALWWHDNYLERLKDFVTGTTRPVRILQFVQRCATHGDALSVISAIDSFCSKVEWAMNVGDKKGEILDAVILETRPRCVLELGTYCGYSAVRIARLLPPGARLVTIEMNPHYAQVAKEVIRHAGLEAQMPLVPDYPVPSGVSSSCSQAEQTASNTTLPPSSNQLRWRLQEALLYTTLQCLQLPLQLFSRTSQNPFTSSSSLPTRKETTERQPAAQTCKVELLVGSSSILIPQLKKKLDIENFDLVFIDHWKVSYLPDTKLMEECGLLRAGSVLLADNVVCPGTPDYLQYVRNSPKYQSQYFQSYLEYLQVEDGLEKSVFLG